MRAIFPLLRHFCRKFVSAEERHYDHLFPRRVRKMRDSIQAEGKLTIKFLSRDQDVMEAILPAADILTEIGLHTVPSDVSYCILRSGRRLAQGIHQLAGKDVSLSADDIFPLFTRVVLTADLPNVHEVLGFLERFSPSRDHVTEFGYWRTTLRASVSYVMEPMPLSEVHNHSA
eukprot:TRINITY_DN4209_c0_g1_i2.p2 TRINITY_DN4209_c0_g1~~TRINITY_DN4209_c0_g1_i2.p2  ORF type:complete len:173 (-),score=21.50 TRINITY_DN4209_c0_g1_i2:144-662(-)